MIAVLGDANSLVCKHVLHLLLCCQQTLPAQQFKGYQTWLQMFVHLLGHYPP